MERRRHQRKNRSEQIRSAVRHRPVRKGGTSLSSVPIKGYERYVLFQSGEIINTETRVKKVLSVKNGYFFCWLHKDGKGEMFYLHRLLAEAFIPNPDKHRYVDHIDRNKQNNDLSNLRWCSQSANLRNRSSTGARRVKGCYYHRQNNRWCARIKVNKRPINLGCYETEKEAADAYQAAKKKHFNT